MPVDKRIIPKFIDNALPYLSRGGSKEYYIEKCRFLQGKVEY